jgi:anti-anti-sigma regulatory factor
MGLDFFISHKGDLAVISLKGDFNEISTGETLQKCLSQTLEESPRGIILHLAEVSSIPRDAHRHFALFMRGIKSDGASIKISSPGQAIRYELVKAGILSETEIKSSLQEAIKTLAAQLNWPIG